MSNLITSEYYKCIIGRRQVYGRFQQSFENRDEYLIFEFKYVGIVQFDPSQNNFQIVGMEELEEYSTPRTVRVNKSTQKESISIISKDYYINRDVQPFEEGVVYIQKEQIQSCIDKFVIKN